MKNEIPVRKKPAHIVVKSSPISNITYNEYCFQNDLKNNNGCKFFGQMGTLKFQYLRPVIIYCGGGVSPPPPPPSRYVRDDWSLFSSHRRLFSLRVTQWSNVCACVNVVEGRWRAFFCLFCEKAVVSYVSAGNWRVAGQIPKRMPDVWQLRS